MTRPRHDLEIVRDLLDQGLSVAEASRRAGIPRSTVRTWVSDGLDNSLDARVEAPPPVRPCDFCSYIKTYPSSRTLTCWACT